MQNDWNGSAKVALISLSRSHVLWQTLAEAAGDVGAAGLAGMAATMHDVVAAEFPTASAFVRPGFDEPVARW